VNAGQRRRQRRLAQRLVGQQVTTARPGRRRTWLPVTNFVMRGCSPHLWLEYSYDYGRQRDVWPISMLRIRGVRRT
jgi:hypothetical protein